MLVNRFDTSKASKVIKLDSGFLRVPVYATRTGVFRYQRKDGSIRRELRHPNEVFNSDSLASLAGVPLTNTHPPVAVTADNYKKYNIGTVSDTIHRKDEGLNSYVATQATVSDSRAIKDVEENGIHEVSCGYRADVVEESGTYNGLVYDAIQKNIRYNHLAIVDKGRAGPSVRLHMDSDAELVEDEKKPDPINNPNGGNGMKLKIDGVEFEVTDSSLASAITNALSKRDGDLTKLNGSIETLKADSQKKVDSLQAKFDALEDTNKELTTKIDGIDVPELVKARVALVSSVIPHLDKETVEKIDELDDKAVKIAVIKAVKNDFDETDKSDDYINARFDAIIETAPKVKTESQSKLDKALNNTVNGGGKDKEVKTADQIRQDNAEVAQNAWQQPLSTSTRKAGN